ncbi:hypothetical protein U876_07695 [Aeromonas hydrophila NJ-35]|nr:hypothetical protein V428_15395 [Aeromonas hydrophila subsp. hydrophila AL09-71]AHX70203.1 hypothetical protein V429_15420 [Aeromonas hydrophila pc104A]AJE35782.1 hypothetical protein V469_07725 [Aeromonas hydrophila J-1]AKJ33979.1 hypothetical protein U876_07695 [Aeromonas hydrophila NJ-35]ALQ62829.1 hypothetical protein AS145_07980 [Aeromonas hydrophila]
MYLGEEIITWQIYLWQQLVNVTPHYPGETISLFQGDIDLTTLNSSYVASINFSSMCECILRYTQLKPSITYSITKFFC